MTTTSEHRAARLALVALFVVALVLRVPGIGDPPLGFHPTRQFRSALLARHIAYKLGAPATAQERRVDQVVADEQGLLEPPILEAVVGAVDRVTGREWEAVPHLLSITFWLIGGWFLLLLTRRFLTPWAVVVCVGFYLLLPYGVVASRSFQPDPLMVMAMLGSLLATVRYHEEPSRQHLLVAGATAGAAVLVKPMSLFVVAAAFTALCLWPPSVRRARAGAAFVVMALLPAVAYFLVVRLVSPNLTTSVEGSFFANLLTTKAYWSRWMTMVAVVVGYVPLAVSIVAWAASPPGLARRLLGALLLGYLGYGMVFNYHIHTHDYYSLQLIPIVAIGLGLMVDRVVAWAREARFDMLGAALLAVIAPVLIATAVLKPLSLQDAEQSRLNLARAILNPDRLQAHSPGRQILSSTRRTYREIGRLVGHSERTVHVAQDYGKPLYYYGRVAGTGWPGAADIAYVRAQGQDPNTGTVLLDEIVTKRKPQWFIVTDFAEYQRQPELRQALESRYRLRHRSDRYLVFDLRRPR